MIAIAFIAHQRVASVPVAGWLPFRNRSFAPAPPATSSHEPRHVYDAAAFGFSSPTSSTEARIIRRLHPWFDGCPGSSSSAPFAGRISDTVAAGIATVTSSLIAIFAVILLLAGVSKDEPIWFAGMARRTHPGSGVGIGFVTQQAPQPSNPLQDCSSGTAAGTQSMKLALRRQHRRHGHPHRPPRHGRRRRPDYRNVLASSSWS